MSVFGRWRLLGGDLGFVFLVLVLMRGFARCWVGSVSGFSLLNLGLVSAAVVLALDWRWREAFGRTWDPLVWPTLLVLLLRSSEWESSVGLVCLHCGSGVASLNFEFEVFGPTELCCKIFIAVEFKFHSNTCSPNQQVFSKLPVSSSFATKCNLELDLYYSNWP